MHTIFSSEQLFKKAKSVIPGGVNSPVRAFKSVGGTPVFTARAEGAYLFDTDNNKYIDYIASWGPMILGHSHSEVIQALTKQIQKGTSYGTPTEPEIEIATLIKSIVPNMDLIRMVNSGTEACMSAVRLARGYTKKNKIIKFEGHYHGHADMFLVKAGSGLATFGIDKAEGIPENTKKDTLLCPYNDMVALEKSVQKYKTDIAAIILEPVAGNMGCIPPQPTFLSDIRKLCTAYNIVLIFDEVMTGFRLGLGGAQEKYNISADLVTYGKIIGGGLPVGAFGGKKEIMEQVAPLGKVYQAGTLSGNPLAMIAGITTLKILKNNPSIFSELNQKTEYLYKGLHEIFKAKNIPYQINKVGSMISVFFCATPVYDFQSALQTNTKHFKIFFHELLRQGIYLPPSPFESWFLNNALSRSDIDETLEKAENALKKINL